jgi:pimeloyl-ACP methyl ester carboxylesterase
MLGEIEEAAMFDGKPDAGGGPPSPPSEGPPQRVVLVHGAPDRARSFNATVRLLTEYAVTTYDRRGYGQRAGHEPKPSGDIFEQAEDLIGVLDGTPAAVVGHSFGAIVAMAASIKAPELISALGLWEPPLVWTSWWPDTSMWDATARLVESRDVDELGERTMRTAIGEKAWQALPAAQRASYRAEGAALHADMRSILREPFAVSSVAAPVVVGYGGGGKFGFDEVARGLASCLSAEVCEMPDVSHLVHVARPERFAHFVRRTVALGSSPLNTD